MSMAEELAQAYADAVLIYWQESLYGTSKSHTLEKSRERDEAHDALTAELRRLAQVEAEHEALKKAISDAEPVAWLRDDGQDGSISTMTNCCSTKVKDLWLKANPIQVERYTIPLYTLEGIRTKP